MKTNNNTSAKQTAKLILKHGRSVKGLRRWVLKHLISIFLALFLISIVAPVNAAPSGSKLRKSSCRHKVISRSYPVVMLKKNNPAFKKFNGNNSRARKGCFPG